MPAGAAARPSVGLRVLPICPTGVTTQGPHSDPELEVEGEMRAESAVDEKIRARLFPSSRLSGKANLLIMPGTADFSTIWDDERSLGASTTSMVVAARFVV